MPHSYSELPNSLVSAANGIDYAYRDTGGHDGTAPLLLLQHFRGNLDSWDPALVDALARSRRVITYDYAGVGGSGGATADTIGQTARDSIAFVAALERVSALELPVFVANGDSDPMILPRYSYLLAGLIPQASVKIYPDAAHGFLFQHHADFAADVEAFLSAPDHDGS